MKKTVRFSELSFIQESEEDSQGEITFAVPNLPAKSVTPTGAPALDSDPSTSQGSDTDVIKPASCPFGDRIAKKQQEDAKTTSPQFKEENHLKFPQSIILLQEQEKAKIAKKKKTAGINPSAGKERGSSFIIARNYLYNVADNCDKFLPRGLSSQHVDFSGAANDTDCSHNLATVCHQDNRTAKHSPHGFGVSTNVTNLNVEPIFSIPYCQHSVSGQVDNGSTDLETLKSAAQNIVTSSSPPPPYSPSPVLTSTVNPFLAPSNQLHGSATYDLKLLPQDNLSKLDIVASSKVNQYLHNSEDLFCHPQHIKSPQNQVPCSYNLISKKEEEKREQDVVCPSHNFQQESAISIDGIQIKGINPDAPSLKFLRENFSAPVPISNDKLFHIAPSISREAIEASVSSKLNNDQSQKQSQEEIHRNTHTSSAPSTSVPLIGPIVVSPRKQAFPSKPTSPGPVLKSSEPLIPGSPTAPATNMSIIGGTQEIYSGVTMLSRVQEKEELQRLSERLTSYVSTVRKLGQQFNKVDTSAFLRSTKILEDEIVTLKTMYEKELEGLRKEIEYNAQERNSLHAQVNKHHTSTGELQDRLSIESEKNSKLLDEINVLQRKIGNLEAEIQDMRVSSQHPREEIDQMQRTMENLTREVEQWKHRYEHENLARQEIEDKFQQMRKKVDFSDQIHSQQVCDFQSRLDTSSATILSLEAKVRELSTADITVAEMLKQVRDTAEAELRKFQIESEEQYSRNLTALKAQIDHDAEALQRMQSEKTELMGNVGELHAKIRSLEGQVANMHHQKQTLEESITVERNRSADSIRQLEIKLREVQDLLVIKMREVTNAREANIPLKAEIEMLKALLEEEERRLRIPLGLVSASIVQTSVNQSPTTSQILNSSVTNQVLKPTTPPNPLSSASAQPISVGFVGSQQASDAVVSRTASIQASTSANLAQSSTAMAQGLPPLTKVVNPTSVTFSASTPTPFQPTEPPKPVSEVPDAPTQTSVINANYNYPPPLPSQSGVPSSLYPYVPSPPLNTQYIPEPLQSYDDGGTLAYDSDYGCGQNDYELYMHGISFPMSGPRYLYEATPSMNRLHVEPSPPISPHMAGSVPARAKSAPVPQNRGSSKSCETKQRNIGLISTNLGNGRDYFDEMFKDLQKETLFSKPRPKSSPLERPLPSTFHDYTVSTSSAIGDLKILEVNQDGKFVRLHNDGPCEVEFGGYMIQQNVGGHPVAVFRFPPRTKFAPDSTVTVWAAMNDPLLHNPPTDFFWKEQQKWGTGPECTTILCRANGQAVAWTTAAHRFTKDAFQETATDADEEGKYSYNKRDGAETTDEDGLTELNIDATVPKPEPVYLRREKQQPPSLVATKHPHGSSPSTSIHPHTGQQRPLRHGNDNSSVNRQSRTQSTRPDPIPASKINIHVVNQTPALPVQLRSTTGSQPYAGAPAQRLGSAPLRKLGNSGSQPVTIRSNGTLANKSSLEFGETSDCPSPFMKPHTRFESGLEQVQSQHHPDFLPPMPRPPHTSW